MVGRLVSLWDGVFSGAMLVSGRVHVRYCTCYNWLVSRLRWSGANFLFSSETYIVCIGTPIFTATYKEKNGSFQFFRVPIRSIGFLKMYECVVLQQALAPYLFSAPYVYSNKSFWKSYNMFLMRKTVSVIFIFAYIFSCIMANNQTTYVFAKIRKTSWWPSLNLWNLWPSWKQVLGGTYTGSVSMYNMKFGPGLSALSQAHLR